MTDERTPDASQFFWLIDELDYGVVLIDTDLKILWLNHALEDLFGIRREDVQGQEVLSFIRNAIAPRIEEGATLLERASYAVAGGISLRDIECHLKEPMGGVEWFDYSSQIVENGPFAGMRMDIYQDVTLRKQLEQELAQHFGHLGEMIEARTKELRELNEQLQHEIQDRRKVEEELSKERDFSSRLIQGSPAFMVAIDARSSVVMMNESMLHALAFTQEEVIGKNYFAQFIPEPDRESLWAFLQEKSSVKEPFAFEHRLRTKEGRELLVEWLGRAVYKDTGEFDYFFGIGIDITERRRVESALSQSENLYRTIFETTGSATIIINEDSTIALANTEFERVFGYTQGETVGRSWIDLISREDGERMKEYHRLRQIDPNLAPRNYEIRLVDRQGEIRNVSVTIAMIPGSGKSVASLLDITERKRAEEEIRQHNRYLSTINQVIAAVASAGSLDELLDVALERTVALLEFDAGAIYLVDPLHKKAALKVQRGLPDWYLKQMETLELQEAPYSRIFGSGEPWYMEKKDIGILSFASIPFLAGEEVIGAVHLATAKQYPFTEKEKEILGSISRQIGSAIQKRMLQEKLEKAYRESTLYLDIISHDINNANNVSIMYAELLADMLEGEKKEFAEKLVASVKRSIEIIGNVSKIRRVYEDKPVLKSIDLDSVIRSEIRTFPDADIRYDGTDAVVTADYLLSEVFANLIGNSLKFGGPAVSIAIRLEDRGDEAEVTVEDNGPGISDKVKPLIFNRFQRGETKASGKGLGLYLSRMLVERYGGTIWVADRVQSHPELGVAIKFRLKKA